MSENPPNSQQIPPVNAEQEAAPFGGDPQTYPPSSPPYPAPMPLHTPPFSRPPTRNAAQWGTIAMVSLGGLVTVIGVLLLVVLAVQRGWLGIEARLIGIAVFGAALILSAFFVRRFKNGDVGANALVITGSSSILIDAIYAYQAHNYISLPVVIVVFLGLNILGISLSYLWKDPFTAGLLGSALLFCTSFLTGTGTELAVLLAVWVAYLLWNIPDFAHDWPYLVALRSVFFFLFPIWFAFNHSVSEIVAVTTLTAIVGLDVVVTVAYGLVIHKRNEATTAAENGSHLATATPSAPLRPVVRLVTPLSGWGPALAFVATSASILMALDVSSTHTSHVAAIVCALALVMLLCGLLFTLDSKVETALYLVAVLYLLRALYDLVDLEWAALTVVVVSTVLTILALQKTQKTTLVAAQIFYGIAAVIVFVFVNPLVMATGGYSGEYSPASEFLRVSHLLTGFALATNAVLLLILLQKYRDFELAQDAGNAANNANEFAAAPNNVPYANAPAFPETAPDPVTQGAQDAPNLPPVPDTSAAETPEPGYYDRKGRWISVTNRATGPGTHIAPDPIAVQQAYLAHRQKSREHSYTFSGIYALVPGIYGLGFGILTIFSLLGLYEFGHLFITVLGAIAAIGCFAWATHHPSSQTMSAILGILLTLFTVGKLFLVDLTAISGLVRISAFLVAGILLLAAGIWYSRSLANNASPDSALGSQGH